VLAAKSLDAVCQLSDQNRQLLATAATRFGLSARACHRVMKVARTIADLSEHEKVESDHLMEALGFREGLANRPSAFP
jgi:magnesium chelatase family protein